MSSPPALAESIPLAPGPLTVSPGLVVLSLAVGFGVPLLAALWPLWNGTRISVRAALSAYGISAGSGNHLLAWLGARLAWVPQTTWLGLRSLFRKRASRGSDAADAHRRRDQLYGGADGFHLDQRDRRLDVGAHPRGR